MSSTYGKNLKVTLFGESHGPAVGVTIENLPAGTVIDMEELRAFLSRRRPGKSPLATARQEDDLPEFLSGIRGNVTTGTPLTAIIRNKDAKSADYAAVRDVPRPGHADHVAEVKYFGNQAFEGGGHFSGRLTAPLAIAGGIVLQLLEKEGVSVISRIASVGTVEDEGELLASTADKPFPAVSDRRAKKMRDLIEKVKAEGDSVGAVVECKILGLPEGIGDPIFDGLENRIAAAVFGIPAVKGVEFGEGFGAARMTGSAHNDFYTVRDGQVATETNHAGGILGGISTGSPVCFRCAFKPTPSIAKVQQSVNLRTLEPAQISVTGRHDPCVAIRALPAVEAAAAIAVCDAILERKQQQP